tara:strand:- start:248 stop:1090 length:843 start_codon:yes stop_codon:yes gene_type:complete
LGKILSNNSVFLLGVGAQKAGTSWLHEQLNKRPDVNFGFCKEYHFFDALTLEPFQRYRPNHAPPWRWRTWRRERFFREPKRYFDYFTRLLNQRKCSVSGDITPSYSCLSSNTMRWIQGEFTQRNIRTCSVFIMRDPVERLLSQQRMQLRKKGKLNPKDELHAFTKLADKLEESKSLRSDYLGTLKSLETVFPPENISLMLFEELFQPECHERFCKQLNIPFYPLEWSKRVNASPTKTTVPDSILARIGKTQAEVYQTLRRDQPQLEVERHWSTASTWCSP